MITTQQITAETASEQIHQLYLLAFPEDEQIPWDALLGLISSMHLDFTAYYRDGSLVGFTIVYPREQFNWFWYFAVLPELRGEGLGQQILSMLIDKYKDCNNFMDMESPDQVCDNQAIRQRRHAFYLRNGFHDTGLIKTMESIDMTIMTYGDATFTMQDWDDVLAELQAHWSWK